MYHQQQDNIVILFIVSYIIFTNNVTVFLLSTMNIHTHMFIDYIIEFLFFYLH